MKKILIILYVVAGLFLATSQTKLNENNIDLSSNINQTNLSIEDSKIGIELIRDGNKVVIKHTSGFELNYAVVEYSYRDKDNKFVAMLDTFHVENDTFTIPANKTNGKAAVGIKVHQLKVLRSNTYYTYSTMNQNSIGSFVGVTRLGFLEIKTTSIQTNVMDSIYSSGNLFSNTKLREFKFYFDFDKKHDYIDYVDVEYVFLSYNWLGKEKSRDRIEDHIQMNSKRSYSAFKVDYIYNDKGQAIPTRTPYTHNYTAFEKNNDKNFKEEYVINVIPSNNKFMETQYQIENFVIVKIYYVVDGEYIIDDVINDPTTPLDQEIFDLMKIIEQIKDFFNTSYNFLVKYWKWFLGGLVVIIALSLLGPVFALIKLIFNVIKLIIRMIFGIPGMIIKFIRALFVPKDRR